MNLDLENSFLKRELKHSTNQTQVGPWDEGREECYRNHAAVLYPGYFATFNFEGIFWHPSQILPHTIFTLITLKDIIITHG